jgi:endonuclease V-like protein UPF0215 family
MEAQPTHVKPEIRVIGIDDSPLVSENILVVGAIMRGGEWLEGVVRTYITKDGLDATEKIAEMVSGTKHYGQIRAVMLNGITFAGFNVVDMDRLHELTGLPVIVIMRKMPDMDSIKSALTHLSETEYRYQLIAKAGTAVAIKAKRGEPVYIQTRGISDEDAIKVVKATAIHSRVPEPVRVAHLIATGIILGESSRRV